MDDGSIAEVPIAAVGYPDPRIGDEVKVYRNDDQVIVRKANNQQAATYAHYAITGLGFDFNEIAKEKIKAVTPEQIKECANKYFNDRYVVSIIKP